MNRREREQVFANRLSAVSRSLDAPRTRLISTERRDPRAATQQLQYISPGMRQIDAWDASSAINDAYLSSVIVFACIRLRANAVASCPLRAILPGQDIAQHDPGAPLARLLGPAPGGPHANMSSRQLWALAVKNKLITGRVAWELEMPQGASGRDWVPVGLWPLIVRALQAVPTESGSELFSEFRYGRYSDLKILRPEQVFYSFIPSLQDIRQAESPLQATRYAITADVLQGISDVAFLRNESKPSGVLVHEYFANPEEGRAWEQQFDAQHRGPWNSNRPIFAERSESNDGSRASVEWIQLGISQKDAQILQSHQAKVQEICIGLGVPMGMLDASGRTYSNAGTEVQNFWETTVLPDLADWEDEINLKLAERLGPHIAKFDLRNVQALKPPAKFTPVSVGDAVDRGLISKEEGRIEMGYAGALPPAEEGGGATLFAQAQSLKLLVDAGYDVATAAGICELEPPTLVIDVTPNVPALPSPANTDLSTTWAASLSLIRSLSAEEQRQERRRAHWRAADALSRAHEGVWVRGLRRLFARQRQAVLKRLNPKRLEKIDELFDKAYWVPETEQAVASLYEGLYAAAGSRAYASAQRAAGGFDVTSASVQARIDYRVSQLAERISETSYDAIRSVVLSGIENGLSMDEIAAGISGVFDEADSNRAMIIARSETIAASADGGLAGYEQAAGDGLLDPATQGKTWIAELDDRTDPECEALDGEVVPFDEPFSSGDDAPPAHAQCRCAIGVDDLPAERGEHPLFHREQAEVLLRAIAAKQMQVKDLEPVA